MDILGLVFYTYICVCVCVRVLCTGNFVLFPFFCILPTVFPKENCPNCKNVMPHKTWVCSGSLDKILTKSS